MKVYAAALLAVLLIGGCVKTETVNEVNEFIEWTRDNYAVAVGIISTAINEDRAFTDAEVIVLSNIKNTFENTYSRLEKKIADQKYAEYFKLARRLFLALKQIV
jgi:hypothetical protein